MAVKAVNDFVGPDGISPTLTVYGAIPRLGLFRDRPSLSTHQRAIAVKKATQALTKHFSSRQVRDAHCARNGPNVTNILSAPIGSHALVYRIERDRWEGPYTILDIDRDDIYLLLPHGPSKFRSTVIKPFVTQNSSGNSSGDSVQDVGDPSALPSSRSITIYCSHPSKTEKYPESYARHLAQSSDDKKYAYSRDAEIFGLLEQGVFSLMPRPVAANNRIFKSRFCDYLKNEGLPTSFEKSRFVLMAYNDNNHGFITHALTVQRSSQRLLLFLVACALSMKLLTRDVIQAYSQSKTSLSRPIYVEPPRILKIPSDLIIRLDRPLYSVPEAGAHWFNTYHGHHATRLNMTAATHDPCLLYTTNLFAENRNPKASRVITCLQTDDTLTVCNNSFPAIEEKESSSFSCKPRHKIALEGSIRFNGATISLLNSSYTISHDRQFDHLATLDPNNFNKLDFISQQACGAYIAAVYRPDLSFPYISSAQVVKPTKEDVISLKNAISFALSTKNQVLRFVALDLTSLFIAVFVDDSFVSNRDSSSQLGFLITIMDNSNHCNIIHYSSSKSRRVARSTLAAELYSLVNGFDYASTMRLAINHKFNSQVLLKLYTDSKSLYDGIVGLNTTTEKRLLIDLRLLRQSYKRREIAEVLLIPSEENPADALTKKKGSPALQCLLQHNSLRLHPNSWIERPVS